MISDSTPSCGESCTECRHIGASKMQPRRFSFAKPLLPAVTCINNAALTLYRKEPWSADLFNDLLSGGLWALKEVVGRRGWTYPIEATKLMSITKRPRNVPVHAVVAALARHPKTSLVPVSGRAAASISCLSLLVLLLGCRTNEGVSASKSHATWVESWRAANPTWRGVHLSVQNDQQATQLNAAPPKLAAVG